MEEYYSGLLKALSHWWTEGEILWKEKITIINWCRFCLIRDSIFWWRCWSSHERLVKGGKWWSEWTSSVAFVFKVSAVRLKHFQLDISWGGFPRKCTCPFQNKSSHAEPFMKFNFFPILVFQNISLANSNACKCNDWSTPPLCSSHSLPSLCIRKASKVNHAVGLALSQKIMGSYSSLSCLSKFCTKGRKLHIPTREILKTLMYQHCPTTT